jgi:hypothetical protein
MHNFSIFERRDQDSDQLGTRQGRRVVFSTQIKAEI